ncbi:hypothetical protein WJX84_004081 [Apatococcus fuscideae]|uniref:FAD dependent oxidoreductase domain-containing protein n=1 Tax=Apatococcus fuscideae TaxID=2026836 RepID=A0AAW1T1Z0_9CHLO
MPAGTVCVLGAGVIGLTTALRTRQELPHLSVTLVAEDFGVNTTSQGSGGLWEPYKLSDTPEASSIAGERPHSISWQTFSILMKQRHQLGNTLCAAEEANVVAQDWRRLAVNPWMLLALGAILNAAVQVRMHGAKVVWWFLPSDQ